MFCKNSVKESSFSETVDAYSSIKDKLLLKYFIRILFGRTPLIFHAYFLKIALRTFSCFLSLCSKELIEHEKTA